MLGFEPTVRFSGQQASAAITRRLLAVGDSSSAPDTTSRDSTGDPLQLIAEHVLAVARADLVTVVLPDGDDLRIEVAVGAGADELRSQIVPLTAGTLSGQVFTTGVAQRVCAPGQSPLTSITSTALDAGPLLVIPLLGPKRSHGVLTVVRRRGRGEFTADDLDTATAFANQASLALELAESRREQQRTAMHDEHDRIAADLHDHVIQRLFASGLTLQSVLGGLPAGKAHDRVQATIGDLDDTGPAPHLGAAAQIGQSAAPLRGADPDAGVADVKGQPLGAGDEIDLGCTVALYETQGTWLSWSIPHN